MLFSLRNLNTRCQAYVTKYQAFAIAFITQSQGDNATCSNIEASLEHYLQNHYALPWYRRWWQRLTQPVNRLETLYHALCLSQLIETQRAKLLQGLTAAKAQLSWFSPLRRAVIEALTALKQHKEEVRPANFAEEKVKEENKEGMMIVHPSQPVPKAGYSLTLTAKQIKACQILNISINQPLNWGAVRQAYLKLLLQHHPDKNQAYDQQIFQQICDGYEVLKAYFTHESTDDEVLQQDIYTDIEYLRQLLAALERQWQQELAELKRRDDEALKTERAAMEKIFKHALEKQRQEFAKYHSELNDELTVLKKDHEMIRAELTAFETDSQTLITTLRTENKQIREALEKFLLQQQSRQLQPSSPLLQSFINPNVVQSRQSSSFF